MPTNIRTGYQQDSNKIKDYTIGKVPVDTVPPHSTLPNLVTAAVDVCTVEPIIVLDAVMACKTNCDAFPIPQWI